MAQETGSADLTIIEENGTLIYRARTVKAAREVEKNLPLPKGKRLAWKAFGWMEEPYEGVGGFKSSGCPADMTNGVKWAQVFVSTDKGMEWVKARPENGICRITSEPSYFEACTDNLAWKI